MSIKLKKSFACETAHPWHAFLPKSMIFAIFFATDHIKAALRALIGTMLVTKHLAGEHPLPKGSGFSLAFINFL